jgi:hypothetical protein
MAEIEVPNPEELEELKEKGFTRRVALTTALFAVMLAITSLGGNNAMKEMLLAQQEASNQWAFYQSKVNREQVCKTNKELVGAILLERGPSMRPEAKSKYETLLKSFEVEEVRYRAEKEKIEEEAKHSETDRDVNRQKDPYFDFAEVLLQIAIVLASISILSGIRIVFYFSIGAAVIGSVLSINGFSMLFQIPFFQ